MCVLFELGLIQHNTGWLKVHHAACHFKKSDCFQHLCLTRRGAERRDAHRHNTVVALNIRTDPLTVTH